MLVLLRQNLGPKQHVESSKADIAPPPPPPLK